MKALAYTIQPSPVQTLMGDLCWITGQKTITLQSAKLSKKLYK